VAVPVALALLAVVPVALLAVVLALVAAGLSIVAVALAVLAVILRYLRRRAVAAFAARAASFGPCFRASFMSMRCCCGGSRRHTSHAAMVSAHGVGRSLRSRPAMP
jgi:hypothetical protein